MHCRWNLVGSQKFALAKGGGLDIASAELVKAVGFFRGGFAVLPPPAV